MWDSSFLVFFALVGNVLYTPKPLPYLIRYTSVQVHSPQRYSWRLRLVGNMRYEVSARVDFIYPGPESS